MTGAAARIAELAERALRHGELPGRFNFARDVFDAWPAGDPAMLWVDDHGTRRRIAFGEFTARSEGLARGLLGAGLQPGDAVLVVMPRLVEWWETSLACLRAGLVLSPGTTQLTAKDLAYRLQAADARAVIADADAAARVDAALGSVAGAGRRPPALRVIVGGEREGWVCYRELCAVPGDFVAADTGPDDPALLYFTSGTTGAPKMTLHTQASYGLGHVVTGRHWLGLRPGDLHWNLSDTGWAKAAYSSLFGPWAAGATVFVHHTPRFDPLATLALLENEPITTFCAAPTLYRLLVQQDLSSFQVPLLRHCAGAGEPLNPEVIAIWERATGLTIHDGYGQTETVLLVGNAPGDEVAPGSMGRPMPGFDVAVIDDDGARRPVGEEGEVAVALTPRRPVDLFSEYFRDPERTAEAFRGGWYRTGDRARVDADGRFWFVARSDDVITSSAYRIGPFEVESALLEHPAVVESAVVGKPDALRGQIVKAYVVLARGHAGDDALVAELQEFVRTHTAPYKYPREIEFVAELPKTVSGKIRRIELRERAAREPPRASGSPG